MKVLSLKTTPVIKGCTQMLVVIVYISILNLQGMNFYEALKSNDNLSCLVRRNMIFLTYCKNSKF